MSLTFSSDIVTNKRVRPAKQPHSAGEEMAVRFKAAVTAALAINNLVGCVVLPPMCVPTDIQVYMDDIDGATSLVWSAGILDTNETDLVTGSKMIDASTAGRTAGLQVMNATGVWDSATWLAETLCPDRMVEKIVAIKIDTAAGTPASGDIQGIVRYVSDNFGV